MTNKRAIVGFLFLMVFQISLSAGETRKAKYAGEFLSTGAGARALALGGSFTALANDVTAIYWNPAGLSHLNFPEATLMHAQRFSGIIKYNFAAFARPFGQDASLGIGIIRLGIDDIIRTKLPRPDLRLGDIYEDEGRQFRNTPVEDYSFSNSEWGFFFSYSKKKSERLFYGASIKTLYKSFDENTAYGIGFDVAVQYQVNNHFLLGANLQDFTTTVLAWDTGTKELIVPTLKMGAAFPYQMKILPGKLMPLVDVDIRFEGREFAAQASAGAMSFDFHLGLEYAFHDRLAARLGSDVGNFTAGAGIHFNSFILDYAFMNHADLQETHRISLLLPLEKERYRRP
ncbi:MAG: hypothetical protein DWQ05_11085 [Calditrichaeota bacterium]|nr:MAG: hypothetical protein DWQ05_11085 [Calditrichota bacterium]